MRSKCSLKRHRLSRTRPRYFILWLLESAPPSRGTPSDPSRASARTKLPQFCEGPPGAPGREFSLLPTRCQLARVDRPPSNPPRGRPAYRLRSILGRRPRGLHSARYSRIPGSTGSDPCETPRLIRPLFSPAQHTWRTLWGSPVSGREALGRDAGALPWSSPRVGLKALEISKLIAIATPSREVPTDYSAAQERRWGQLLPIRRRSEQYKKAVISPS